ncbi:unnamed protein product [Pylaiella littoralis]
MRRCYHVFFILFLIAQSCFRMKHAAVFITFLMAFHTCHIPHGVPCVPNSHLRVLHDTFWNPWNGRPMS